MLDKDHLDKLIQEISAARQIAPADIPDIDLYMDQVTTFMDNKLEGLKRNEKDKVLTKAMINNYAKAGILLPPQNKKYSKKNMILLILIYKLKQVMSINDIELLFKPLFKGLEEDESFLEDVYNAFLQLDTLRGSDFTDGVYLEAESITSITADLKSGDGEKTRWMLLAMILAAKADAQKRLAEKIIDHYLQKD